MLAVSKLYLGDTDFNDAPDKANGWKQFGRNIDGKISTAASLDLCQPLANANKASVYPDGNSGIDNAFSKNILPIFLGLVPNVSDSVNQSIANGSFTIEVDLVNLAPAADQGPFTARLYTGTQLGSAPKFDGTDCWPVAPEGLTNAQDITSAKVGFSTAQLTSNAFASGPTAAAFPVTITVQGFPLSLNLHDVQVTADLNAMHDDTVDGQISGILDVTELSDTVRQLAGSFDASLCNGATIDSILTQIRQASDILLDGTQDPQKSCEGISIGLGFKAHVVTFGAVGPASPPPPKPCP